MKKNRIAAAALCAVIAGSSIFALGTPVYADWTKENGSTYYTDASGKKATGLKTIDGDKYYFGKDGKMRKGWVVNGTKIYYFGTDGKMRTGKVTVGDVEYNIGKNGVVKVDQGYKDFTWTTTQESMAKATAGSMLSFGPMVFGFDQSFSNVYLFDAEGNPAMIIKGTPMPKGVTYYKKVLKKEGFKYTGKESIDGTTAYVYKKGTNIALVAKEEDMSMVIYLSPSLSLLCASKGYDAMSAEFQKMLEDYDWESALADFDLSGIDISQLELPSF